MMRALYLRPGPIAILRRWIRCMHLRMLIRAAEFDIENLEADLAALPARITGHRRHAETLRVELACVEQGK